MKIYIIREFEDYYNADVVKVFSKESDAENYVKKNFWKHNGEEGIWYEEHEVE